MVTIMYRACIRFVRAARIRFIQILLFALILSTLAGGRAYAGSGTLGDPFTHPLEAHSAPSSGRYYFNFGGGVFEADVDNSEGGGWILILQYVHQGGTNPALSTIAAGSDLPELSAATLGTDESSIAARWGHAGNAAINAFPGGLETRWYGATGNHSRIIHFKTTTGESYLRTGTGNFSGVASNYTALTGHTAFIPGDSDNYWINQGNLALTQFPFYKHAAYHWGIQGAGHHWEVDDYTANHLQNTIHRVWVRSTTPDRSDTPADGSTAPNGSSTTAYGNATHRIEAGIQLGAAIDADTASINSANADGDGTDDDGVNIPVFTQDITSYINIDVQQNTAGDGYLQGWIDWNGDGDFADAGEQIATDLQLTSATSGTITVAARAPATAITTQTFARFRWSSTAGLDSSTAASDGEVEDYALTVIANPPATAQCSSTSANIATSGTATQSSTSNAGIASRAIDGNTSGIYADGSITHTHLERPPWLDVDLGAIEDIDSITLWNRTDCCGDRLDDFHLFVSDTPFPQTSDNLADLQSILADSNVTKYQHSGTTAVSTNVPIDGAGRYVRVQLPGDTSNYLSLAEVEVNQCQTDHSDAPADGSTGPDGGTTAYGEATHGLDATIRLGATITADTSSVEDADDASDDGLVFNGASSINLINASVENATSNSLEVTPSTAGFFNLWIDYNANGTFEASEQVFNDTPVTAGAQSLTYTVSSSAVPGQTYARARFSSTAGQANTATGAALNGEVEDYSVIIHRAAEPLSCDADGTVFSSLDFRYFERVSSTAHRAKNVGALPDGTVLDLEISSSTGITWDGTQTAPGTPVIEIVGAAYTTSNITMNLFEAGTTTPATGNFVFQFPDIDGDNRDVSPADGVGDSAPSMPITTYNVSNEYQHFYNIHDFELGDDPRLYEDATSNPPSDLFLQSAASNNYDGSLSPSQLAVRVAWKNVSQIQYSYHGGQFGGSNIDGQGIDTLGITAPCYEDDYSDAPATYGEAAHTVTAGIQLGAAIDIDTASITSTNADGDGADDDGVSFPALVPGDSGTITVSVSGAGFLQGWIDWNGNGVFDSPTEQIAEDLQDFGTGTISIPVTVPADAITTQTFARFRWSSDYGIGPDGAAPDGEVEDYAITFGATGPVLSGTVFIDNGTGGGSAHDAVINGSETVSQSASVSLYDSTGTLIAMPPVNADGTWSYTLPTGFNAPVTVTATPQPGWITISEQTAGLPSLVNSDAHDGSYTFTPSASGVYSALDIGLIEEPRLTQNQSVSIAAGQIVELQHTYTATSSANVTFSIVDPLMAPDGAFSVTLFEDSNCDGTPDTVISGAQAVTAGESVCLISRVAASSGVGPGAQLSYGLTAASAFTATSKTLSARNDDVVQAGTGSDQLTLQKTVRNVTKNTAEGTANVGDIGDVLEYRLILSNPSGEPATNVTVNDRTPAYTALTGPITSPVTVAPGVSCSLAVPVSNTAGYAGPLEWTCPGTFPPGELGALSFQVTISP